MKRIFRGVALRRKLNRFGETVLLVSPGLAKVLAEFVGQKIEIQIEPMSDDGWFGTGRSFRFKNGRPE